MSAKRTSSVLIGALFIGALSGCEVVDCDKNPEKEVCQDDPEEDGGDSWEDADTPESDAGLDGGGSDGGRDGGSADAGDARADGSSADGATSDASQDAGPSEPLTIDEFCIAQLASAVAWRDGLEEICGSSNAIDERNAFLQSVFGYIDTAEDRCVTNLKSITNSGHTMFDGTKAQACVDKFLAGYDAPPSPFPADGIDLANVTANVGHGAVSFAQIPECRAAFKGTVARDKPCTGGVEADAGVAADGGVSDGGVPNSLECVEGLRCMAAPGGGMTCQPALTIGTCTLNAHCADGYICVGSTAGGGKTCVRTTDLPTIGGNCTLSSECSKGLVCSSNKCANPTAQVICKP